MNDAKTNPQEQKAASAFSSQAPIFDALYSTDDIIQYKRKRVRQHLQQYLSINSNILELNSGTGEDAIWFAQQGHRVHATDISDEMLAVLENKVQSHQLQNKISNELCSFTALDRLHFKGPYDMIFSNFAGLNCTHELGKVLASLSALLKPGGIVTLVILPRFCLWEFLLIFKGMFATATRRQRSSKGVAAKIENNTFNCWYYNPSFVVRHMKNDFTLLKTEGLCTIVPPSYISGFAKKHPRLFKWLTVKENKWKENWPWRFIGDYFIISLQKKTGAGL